MVMIDDACSFSRVKSSLYGDDVNDRRFCKEFARHICGRVLRYHFFVRVVQILVIREQRRGEQHHEWWQRDEE